MDKVESLRLGGAADATDSAGRSRKEDEQKKRKKEVDDPVTGGWHLHQRRQRRL
jgi:hypothetical protein